MIESLCRVSHRYHLLSLRTKQLTSFNSFHKELVFEPFGLFPHNYHEISFHTWNTQEAAFFRISISNTNCSLMGAVYFGTTSRQAKRFRFSYWRHNKRLMLHIWTSKTTSNWWIVHPEESKILISFMDSLTKIIHAGSSLFDRLYNAFSNWILGGHEALWGMCGPTHCMQLMRCSTHHAVWWSLCKNCLPLVTAEGGSACHVLELCLAHMTMTVCIGSWGLVESKLQIPHVT